MAQLTVLLCGDPHIKDNNVKEIEILLEDCLRYIDQWNPDLVVVMGDLIDSHDKVKMMAHKRAVKFLLSLASKRRTVLLIGNHDRPPHQRFLYEDHYFTGVARPGILDIVERPTWINLEKAGFSYKLAFLPYLPTGSMFATLTAENFDISTAQATFAHQELRGCDMDDSNCKPIISRAGDAWPSNFGPIFCGHIHKRQHFGNVYYIGSPKQERFSEDENKGLAKLILSSEGMKLEYYPTNIPLRKIFSLTPDQFYNFQPPENVRFRIIVSGTAEQLKIVEASPQYKSYDRQQVELETIKQETVVAQMTLKERTNFWGYVNSQLTDRQRQLLAGMPK